jgi:cytoskeletal protein CcmA (bactofilin family)
MWGKKDVTPPSPPPKPAPPVEEVKPVSTAAMPRVVEPERSAARPGAAAHIGKSVLVKGEVSGSEDLFVDGEVQGSIDLKEHSLTVGPNGKVHANVTAREIVIQGTLNGNVRASDRVEIRKTGSLLGDLTTARISIEDGAYFKGSIDILKPGHKPEPARPAVSGNQAKPAAQPALQMAASDAGKG